MSYMSYILLGCYVAMMGLCGVRAYKNEHKSGWIVATVAWGIASILQGDLL